MRHNGGVSNPYRPPTSPDPSRGPYPTGDEQGPYASRDASLQAYPGHGSVPAEHPQGTLVFVLGIVGVVFPIAAPFAWVLGGRVLRDIRASGVPASNQQLVAVGRILGIVMTLLMVLGFLLGVVLVVLTAAAASAVH